VTNVSEVPSERVTLFEDDFESGEFSTGGWVLDGTPEITSDSRFIGNGTYAALLRGDPALDPDESLIKQLNLTGFGAIELSYFRGIYNTEDDDSFLAQFSTTGGSSWVTLETLHNDNDVASTTVSFDLSAISGGALDNNPDVRIRFIVTSGNHTNDRFFIDNVAVTGTPL
jgi:hypothetical protein